MITNAFPNKIWLDKGSYFYNRSIKSWVLDSDIEIYSSYDKGKYFVAERFITTLKKRIYYYLN